MKNTISQMQHLEKVETGECLCMEDLMGCAVVPALSN
jgi:hypothetical protein